VLSRTLDYEMTTTYGDDAGAGCSDSGRIRAVDGRRSLAKRFRALVTDFGHDLGSEVTAAESALIRQAAAVTVKAEQLRAELLSGMPVTTNDLVRSTNAVTRILTALAALGHNRGPAHVPMRDRYGSG
jgi:hypothetical protein